MLARLRTWLEHRTGYRRLVQALLLEHIPGGAKWRYVWGSCLAFVFTLQVLTGILLMTAYSPGDTNAWGSVYFIQYEMEFGWLIRGLHHFGSQGMVVLLGIHMLQVVIAGAHLSPREINWWLGLGLMGLVLAMSLTGYLLPWDQKGFFATQVATNIAGNIPFVGSFLKTVIVGGPEYGNATLTRFYALHVAIVPALIVVLLVAHVALFRRHGVTAPKDAEGEGLFWPDQAFKDMVACMGVFGILLGLVVWGGHGNPVEFAAFHRPAVEVQAGAKPEPPADPGTWDRIAYGGREGRGANLDAPAVPGGFYPARPEWYFLFLFQLLKYFPGGSLVGTVIIPNGAGVVLFLLPFLGYGRLRPFGHVVAVLAVVGLLCAVGALTCFALADDTAKPLPRLLLVELGTYVIPGLGGLFLIYLALLALLRKGGLRRFVSFSGALLLLTLLAGAGTGIYAAQTDDIPAEVQAFLQERRQGFSPEEKRHEEEALKRAEGFRHQLEVAETEGKRAVVVAAAGIPAEGAAQLLQRDPDTQGPKLFKMHCGSCHSYRYDPVTKRDFFHPRPKKEDPRDKLPIFTAGDLADFGSKKWIVGLLTEPDSPRYFGHTPFKGGKMSSWVLGRRSGGTKKLEKVEAEFAEIADWLATHPREVPEANPKKAPKQKDAKAVSAVAGALAFAKRCQRCHTVGKITADADEDRGPDLTGYGSQEWLRLMITDPHDLHRYDPGRYGWTGDKAPMNAMPIFRDKEGLTWPAQDLHLQRSRERLRARLNPKAEKAAVKDAVPLVSLPFAGVVAFAAPSGSVPVLTSLVAIGAAQKLGDSEDKLNSRFEEARARARAAVGARVEKATSVSQLSDVERELIVRWLTRDSRVVFGGARIAVGKKKR